VSERVEVRGRAYPAAAGPLVVGDDGRSYYLGGVADWSDDMIGQPVVVTGTPRVRAPQTEVRPRDEEQSHGLTDETTVLDDADWRPA
jgi:hypothetical protein